MDRVDSELVHKALPLMAILCWDLPVLTQLRASSGVKKKTPESKYFIPVPALSISNLKF
jgi:hypothetical protein